MIKKERNTELDNQCYHCGQAADDKIIPFDNKVFCCEGCVTVYRIIHSKGLSNYYELANNPGNNPSRTTATGDYAFLDEPKIADQLYDFKDDTYARVTFYIPGIHCISCVWLLETLHSFEPAIIESRVNFLKKQVSVSFDPSRISLKNLVLLLVKLGYEPKLQVLDAKTKRRNPLRTQMLSKLVVAGFCFGNSMLFSLGNYFGLDVSSDPFFQRLFDALNGLLSIPVLLYSGSDYLKSAWHSLKSRKVNIDIPLAIGILALFTRSWYEIITATGPGYFDSLAGLIFFLLCGKWFQSYTFDNLSFERDYKSFFPLAVSVLRGNKEVSLSVNELEKGDRIRIRNHELIPSDCVLCSGVGAIDYSFVNGESRCRDVVSGQTVYAGGRQMGGTIELEVTRETSQSYLTQLWNSPTFTKEKESKIISFTNKISKYFIVGLIIISVLAFAFWYLKGDFFRGINAFTSILIIACPCALSLSIPFVLGNATRIFGRNQLYLKSYKVVQELAAADTFVFDKTGTITVNKEAEPKYYGTELTADDIEIIASLTSQSTHPLSKSIYKYLRITDPEPVTSFESIPGLGISGRSGNRFARIGNAVFCDIDDDTDNVQVTRTYVNIDNKVKGYFEFANKYRDNIQDTLTELQKENEVHVISGDNESEKEYLEKLIGEHTNIHFHFSPFDKMEYIDKLQAQGKKVVMCGDGINDSGALKRADMGISVTEDTSDFSPSSDAIIQADQLSKLKGFKRFAEDTTRVIYINFAVSLVYNAIGLYIAFQGMLSPVFAAIIMPVSSVSIILVAIGGTNYYARKGGLI